MTACPQRIGRVQPHGEAGEQLFGGQAEVEGQQTEAAAAAQPQRRLAEQPWQLVAQCHGLPLIVLVWMVDRKVALLFAMPFLSLLRVPAFALRLALGDEMANLTVLASQRVTPSRLNDAGFTWHLPTVEAMLRFELGLVSS